MNQALGLLAHGKSKQLLVDCVAGRYLSGKTEAGLRFISAVCNKTQLQRENRREDKQTLVEFQANEVAFTRP